VVSCVAVRRQVQEIILSKPEHGRDDISELISDQDIEGMGLSHILCMFLVEASHIDDNDLPLQETRIERYFGAVTEVKRCSLVLSQDGSRAIEYKEYPTNMDQHQQKIQEHRIDRLAKTLQAASAATEDSLPTEFLTLKCRGYFRESTKNRFGLEFELPPHNPTSSVPTTLHEAINSGKYKLALGARLAIAATLGEAVYNWHSARWHHQSISSHNVIFFSTPTSTEPDFTRPYLCGFDFSRESGKVSATRSAEDALFSLYRHPDRQFEATSSHKLKHDIYSYGVVLLELGLWDKTLHEDTMTRGLKKPQPETVEDALLVRKTLKGFTGRLRFYVGDEYARAVYECVDGRSFDSAVGAEVPGLFRDRVLSKLHSGVGL
jgi:hypothetical protein